MRINVRLADYIRSEIESILQDWEEFAKTIFHAEHMSKAGLRDHARDMLLVIADDLDSYQNESDQAVAEPLEHYATAKEMETRLFGAILLASPDPIYVLDVQGRFVYANKATADLFAMRPEEIIGQSSFDLEFPFASDFQRNLDKTDPLIRLHFDAPSSLIKIVLLVLALLLIVATALPLLRLDQWWIRIFDFPERRSPPQASYFSPSITAMACLCTAGWS